VSINVSQIFVRYPDEKDAAEILARYLAAGGERPSSFIVARTPGPWLAVLAGDNTPAPEVAQLLSRALEAAAIWFGLAGNTLAYRLIRYAWGRRLEEIQEPPEIFRTEADFPLPEYRDVEEILYRRLRAEGIPAEYVYLFAEEVGAESSGGRAHAAVVRAGTVEPFAHRVPRRGADAVRTLFDLYKEGEQVVYEMLHLRGTFDEGRAERLLRTLEDVCRRRTLPPGWKVRYLAGSARDPELGRRLAAAHAKGRFSFELEPPPAE
jgi:hypothetical protein